MNGGCIFIFFSKRRRQSKFALVPGAGRKGKKTIVEGGMPGGRGTGIRAHLEAEVCGLVGDLELAPVRGVGDEVSLDGLNDVRGEGFADDDDGTLFGLEL